MRVIVIGATGTIGQALVKTLSVHHDVVKVGHKDGGFHVDIASVDSIKTLYDSVGSFDAVVCAAGLAKFGRFEELKEADYLLGLTNKLMGQVNLVRIGRQYLKDKGCFTLTSGILSQEPMKGSASISMVNAGLDGFVRAAALELAPHLRINAVSPPWVKETMEAMGMESSSGMPAEKVALAYLNAVEGTRTGQILDPRSLIKN
jgi:NAD(P)-dependent dehydrogenase (short-subunit alcohol dehydrogenase family)